MKLDKRGLSLQIEWMKVMWAKIVFSNETCRSLAHTPNEGYWDRNAWNRPAVTQIAGGSVSFQDYTLHRWQESRAAITLQRIILWCKTLSNLYIVSQKSIIDQPRLCPNPLLTYAEFRRTTQDLYIILRVEAHLNHLSHTTNVTYVKCKWCLS